MKTSPSLFFDILTTEDEEKRDEKIRRASFEIKTAHATGSPAVVKRRVLPASAFAQANGSNSSPTAAHSGGSSSSLQQQQQFEHDDQGCSSSQGGSPVSPSCISQQFPRVGQHQDGQQQAVVQAESVDGVVDIRNVVLSPQEVLQELLGDMYIDESRLTMGELLGQGGFADVHAAELSDPLLPAFSESVAVKRLRPDVLKGPDDLREFLTEANLLRKLQHRNIVRLRGVGATDLTDLVSMRESMFVVQEFMAGGDLKALVLSAMSSPFEPPYTKSQAFGWAMQIAEAMHYLHSVCCPMIIHRDLKLDNVLLTGGNMHERVAKLADFGLHKRVRKMTNSGALVAWSQETTYHGGEYEKSFYGGKLYLVKSAISIASSVDGGSMHGGAAGGGCSTAGNSMHGGGGSMHGGGGGSLHRASGAGAALAAANGDGAGAVGEQAANGTAAAGGATKPPAGPGPINSSSSKPPLPRNGSVVTFAAGPATTGSSGGGAGGLTKGASGVQCSDSAASLPDDAAGAGDGDGDGDNGSGAGVYSKQQQELLQGAVRAKSQGLLGKQEFVTRVLAVPSNSSALQQGPMLQGGDKEVARTFAAVQALEGSVRAGSAFYQQQPQPQQQQQAAAAAVAPQQQQQRKSPTGSLSGKSGRGATSSSSGLRRKLGGGGGGGGGKAQELCPQLLQALQAGGGEGQTGSLKFIEATQKVGSLIYMAPEVLTGHQYNEKIDVFSFGIILYELLCGVVVASRVALAGEHDELLDYARQVANGHREAVPAHWPSQVRALISACWAQDPRARPSFKQVLKQLYEMKQAGIDVQMEGLRPRGDYNPISDCGCSIM